MNCSEGVLYHKCPEESNVRTVHAVTVALAEIDDLRVVNGGISTRRSSVINQNAYEAV